MNAPTSWEVCRMATTRCGACGSPSRYASAICHPYRDSSDSFCVFYQARDDAWCH